MIGNGVVLDPIKFKDEADSLYEKFNINLKDNLILSNRAALIVPTHKLLDKAYEFSKGDKKIGSTLKGIGPTYQDKIGRNGLRVGDLLLPDFKEKYEELKKKHLLILSYYNLDVDNIEDCLLYTSDAADD